MTAPVATTANLMSGTREFGQVTNTYSGYLQSAGSAYDITLPWQADSFEWWNYTKFGTNANNLSGIWFRDFPAGDALITARGTTTLTSTLETTNGVTIANTGGGFVNQHYTITGLSAGVVTTSTATGLVSGDRIMITKVIGTVAAEVNNMEWVVQPITSTTFALYDVYGVPFVQVGTYTSSGQVTIEGPSLYIQDVPITYKLTLGSAVMGADNDVIYFRASKYNSYLNIGDVA